MKISQFIITKFAYLAELYITKPIAGRLIFGGIGLMMASMGLQWQFTKKVFGGTFTIGNAASFPILEVFTFFIGVVLIAIGVKMALETHRLLQRKKVIVLEIRGLKETLDQRLIDAIPKTVRGHRIEKLFDVRNKVYGKEFQIQEALSEINNTHLVLRTESSGNNREDLQVYVGGLAPVPLLVLMGNLISAQTKYHLYDWNRFNSCWQPISTGVTKEFKYANLEKFENVSEIALVISMSYPVDLASVQISFPGMPVINMVEDRLGLGEFLDESSLGAFASRFAQTLVEIGGQGIKYVHLVVATPSSVALAIGRIYDGRNMPKVIVYQYQRDLEHNQYPWGVLLPTSDTFKGSYIENSQGRAAA